MQFPRQSCCPPWPRSAALRLRPSFCGNRRYVRSSRVVVMDTLRGRGAAEVEGGGRAAVVGDPPLEIIGHGSKRRIGQPMATNAVLDVSALNAVMSYEPNEL